MGIMRAGASNILNSPWSKRFWRYLDESSAKTASAQLKAKGPDTEKLLWLLYLYSSPTGSLVHQKIRKSASQIVHLLDVTAQTLKELDGAVESWPPLVDVAMLALQLKPKDSGLRPSLRRWIKELEVESDRYARASYEDIREQYFVLIWTMIRKGNVRLDYPNTACVFEAAFNASDNVRRFGPEDIKQLVSSVRDRHETHV
jgi:hypothetical protein